MSLLLSPSDQYPHIASISLIILVLVFSLWLIFRMEFGQIFNQSSITYVKQTPIKPSPMIAITNPFVVILDDAIQSSLQNGVGLKLSSQAKSILQIFWGVKVPELNDYLLHNKFSNIYQQLNTDNFISGLYLDATNKIRVPEGLNQQYFYDIPQNVSFEDLGLHPRKRYPIVMVLSVDEENVEYENYGQTDIVTLICLIHLKDSSCPMESQIIAEYIRNKGGQMISVKKLYVERNEIASIPVTSEDCNDTIQDCILCQSKPITRALLPCRHTCICGSCFNRLEGRCPMCRSPITSFFLIGDEDEDPVEQNYTPQPVTVFDRADQFVNGLIQWSSNHL